jgi:type IV secretion system protein VirB2
MTHVDAFRLSVNPLSRLSSMARLRHLARPQGKGCCWPR